MASASGVFSDRGRYSLVITVNQIGQSIPGNYSTVSVLVQVVETTENGSWDGTPASWGSWVEGQTDGGTFTYDFRAVNVVTLLNTTKNIGHNADGTKAIWFEASVGGGTTIGSAWAGASMGLSTIPRASTPSWAPGTPTTEAGGTYTLNTNRASGSFTHDITYTFGSASGTVGTAIGASTSWTIPLALLNQMPNSATGTGTFTTKTYNGTTLIGTTTTSFSVTAPASVIPTWTSVTTSEGVSDVATKVGAFVQGVSKVSYAINGAAGVYGSTISQRRLTVAGQTVDGASGTTPNPINASGTVPAVLTITDSRGRVKTQTNNLTFLAYSTPVINSYTIVRSLSDGTADPDDGTYLKVTTNANVRSLINSTQRNSITFRVWTKLTTASTWTLSRTYVPGGIAYNSSFVVTGPFAVDKAYDVRLEVVDIFNTASAATTIPVAAVFMHWGAGLGVGKYHENGALDVGGDGYFTGNGNFGGDVNIASGKKFSIAGENIRRYGTTAERNAIFGSPANVAQQVALANKKVIWFNTDTYCEESYYAVHGSAGLTARGLMTGGPTAGWYPTGELGAPRIHLNTSGGKASTNGTEFNNWKPLTGTAQTAITTDELPSWRIGTVFTYDGNSYIETTMWARVRVSFIMDFPGGSGTGYFALAKYRPSTSSNVLDFHKAAPLGPDGIQREWLINDSVFRPGDRWYGRTVLANWTVGSNSMSSFDIQYLGPPLVGA